MGSQCGLGQHAEPCHRVDVRQLADDDYAAGEWYVSRDGLQKVGTICIADCVNRALEGGAPRVRDDLRGLRDVPAVEHAIERLAEQRFALTASRRAVGDGPENLKNEAERMYGGFTSLRRDLAQRLRRAMPDCG